MKAKNVTHLKKFMPKYDIDRVAAIRETVGFYKKDDNLILSVTDRYSVLEVNLGTWSAELDAYNKYPMNALPVRFLDIWVAEMGKEAVLTASILAHIIAKNSIEITPHIETHRLFWGLKFVEQERVKLNLDLLTRLKPFMKTPVFRFTDGGTVLFEEGNVRYLLQPMKIEERVDDYA